ncbi:MAG: hypothetical protein MHPSP_002957, partial [Paramarteilia canceri]
DKEKLSNGNKDSNDAETSAKRQKIDEKEGKNEPELVTEDQKEDIVDAYFTLGIVKVYGLAEKGNEWIPAAKGILELVKCEEENKKGLHLIIRQSLLKTVLFHGYIASNVQKLELEKLPKSGHFKMVMLELTKLKEKEADTSESLKNFLIRSSVSDIEKLKNEIEHFLSWECETAENEVDAKKCENHDDKKSENSK